MARLIAGKQQADLNPVLLVLHGRWEAFPRLPAPGPAGPCRAPCHSDDGPTGLSPEFEVLRWFALPPACLPSQAAWPVDIDTECR